MKHRFSLLLIFLCIGFTLTAQTNRRIVSLAASITRNLYEMGAGGQIVGCTKFCVTDPHDAIAVVAEAVNVNLERIALLKPDVVLAGGLTHPRVIESLKKMGIRTMQWHQPKDFDDICRQFREMGEVAGRPVTADSIILKAQHRMADIASMAGNNPKYYLRRQKQPHIYPQRRYQQPHTAVVCADDRGRVANSTMKNEKQLRSAQSEK